MSCCFMYIRIYIKPLQCVLCGYPSCISDCTHLVSVPCMFCVSVVKTAAALARMGEVYRKEWERLVSSFYRPAHVDLVQERFLHTCPQGVCLSVLNGELYHLQCNDSDHNMPSTAVRTYTHLCG